MKITMLLCDHAEVAEGKLFINGSGWSVTTAGASPMGVAILMQVPWDSTNRDIRFALSLEDADGQAVMTTGFAGVLEPIILRGEFQVGRPAGVAAGSSLDVPLAVNVPPPPLQPGRRYQWAMSIDGERSADWTVPFATRPANTLQVPGF